MQTTFDPASTYRPMRLGAGESLHLPVRAGTAVQVLAGSVQLCGPARWLAGTVYRAPQRLGEGQWLVLDDAGWLQLEAGNATVGEVQLLVVEPAEPVAWLWRRLRALLAAARPSRVQA